MKSKKKCRKILAYVLTWVMLFSIIPETGSVSYAEEVVEETTQETSEEDKSGDIRPDEPEQIVSEESTTEISEVQNPTSEMPEAVSKEETALEEEVSNGETITETENSETSEEMETEEEKIVAGEEENLGMVLTENVENTKASSDIYTIYSDGSWDGGAIWYVGNKHHIFCLNHGTTMYTGLYKGTVTKGYSGKSAFKKAVALHYFYKTNGNSWAGKKNYGPVQEVIWDWSNSETAKKLTTYINHAWKMCDLNASRTAGSASYSSKLKAIKQSEQKDKAARKTMIANLTDSKKVLDLSNSFDKDTKSYKKTIQLGGTAWKYFNNGGFDGGSSDIAVDGIFKTDGSKITDGSCSAKVNESGNLVVEIVPTETDGKDEESAYTVIMHVNFDYKGAASLNYLLTPSGKQNLTYNADFSGTAYFAVRVYGDTPTKIPAKLYINKVDEFGNFVSGCTFQLTGVQGDALANQVDDFLHVNGENYYFGIEYPGYYKLVEIAVPSSEYKLDTTEHYIYAAYNDDNELLLYEAYKKADGSYGYYKSAASGSVGSTITSGNAAHKGAGTAAFQYYFPNVYTSGSAVLTKYANVLTKYEDGEFVYEQRTLDDVGFTFHAAEDIYINETLVFEKDEEIYSGTHWGAVAGASGLIGTPEYKHTVHIDGNLVLHHADIHVSLGSYYRGYTANGGKLTIEDLPAGTYYCVESDLSHPGLVIAVERYYFDIEPEQTACIHGADGILNEQAPTDVCVYKVDANTKEYLVGAEFTLYAHIDNTNYDGKKLFKNSQTVGVVTQRNLATGKEVVESNTWIPIRTAVSNNKGLALFENLPYGEYLIAETKAPEGYALAEKTIRFTHSLSSNLLTDHASGFVFQYEIGNIKTSGFQIYKKAEKAYLNAESEKNVDAYIYKAEAVEGVIFGIYADEEIKNTTGEVVYRKGSLVTTCTTNAEGIAQFGGALYAGKYYFQEIQTADDEIYELDCTKHAFEVTGKENTRVLTDEALINKQYKGSIKVIKTDGRTKEYLEDVEFKLLDAQQNVIGTYVTNDKGEILIDHLPVGTYYLQESKTQKGYKLDEEIKEIVLSADDLHKQVEMKNYRTDTKITIKTDTTYSGGGKVKTGDMSPVGLMFLLFFMSICGCVILACSKKKELVSARTRKLMALLLVLTGVIALGGLTVKAAAEYKEIALEELQDVEYNGTIYQYALQKQYETSNPEQEITFDEEVDGWKLADIQYELVDTILQKKMVEETRDYKNLIVKDEDKIAKTITLDDQVYELQGITWSAEPNIETVSYTVDYGYQTAEPTPDATYEYTYTSPVTKKDNTVTLPFVRLEQGGTDWVDGFSAIVTFHNLDGLYFTLGDNEITYNADTLSLTSSDYRELVKMLGYDTSKYRFNSISWDGKAYKKNNQKCRDAKATGQQYATLYKAIYEDEVENGKIYTAHATYACEVELPEEEAAPTYVMEATAYYEEANVWTNIISFVTEHKAVSVVAIIGILFFIILVIVSVMKKQTAKNKPVEWSSVKERPREE